MHLTALAAGKLIHTISLLCDIRVCEERQKEFYQCTSQFTTQDGYITQCSSAHRTLRSKPQT